MKNKNSEQASKFCRDVRNNMQNFTKHPIIYITNWMFWIATFFVVNLIVNKQLFNLSGENADIISSLLFTIFWGGIVFGKFFIIPFIKNKEKWEEIVKRSLIQTAIYEMWIFIIMVAILVFNGVIKIEGNPVICEKFIPGKEIVEVIEKKVPVYKEVEITSPVLPIQFSDDSTIVIDSGNNCFPIDWYERNTVFFSTYKVFINRNNRLENLTTEIKDLEFGNANNTILPVIEADFDGDIVYIGYPGDKIESDNAKFHNSTIVIVSPKKITKEMKENLNHFFAQVKIVSFENYK